MEKYKLDDRGEPVLASSLQDWAAWTEYDRASGRNLWRVGETFCGTVRISTVFLGLDHNFGGVGPPILWETMVFFPLNSRRSGEQERCSGSREQALAMHAAMVERVQAVLALEL